MSVSDIENIFSGTYLGYILDKIELTKKLDTVMIPTIDFMIY